jgi:hypothetical protein
MTFNGIYGVISQNMELTHWYHRKGLSWEFNFGWFGFILTSFCKEAEICFIASLRSSTRSCLHLWMYFKVSHMCGLYAEVGHYATNQKVAGRTPDEVDFFNWPNPSSRTVALRSTQPLTEKSTRNLFEGKGRPERKVNSLTSICEPIV